MHSRGCSISKQRGSVDMDPIIAALVAGYAGYPVLLKLIMACHEKRVEMYEEQVRYRQELIERLRDAADA